MLDFPLAVFVFHVSPVEMPSEVSDISPTLISSDFGIVPAGLEPAS